MIFSEAKEDIYKSKEIAKKQTNKKTKKKVFGKFYSWWRSKHCF